MSELGKLRSQDAIDTEALTVYQALWEELMKVVREANEKGFTLEPGGSITERWIQNGYSTVDMDLPRVTLTLAKDKRSLTARAHGMSVTFAIGISEGEVVCLKQNGLPVSMEDAAHLIMEPFLFPELSKGRTG